MQPEDSFVVAAQDECVNPPTLTYTQKFWQRFKLVVVKVSNSKRTNKTIVSFPDQGPEPTDKSPSENKISLAGHLLNSPTITPF